MMSNSLRIVSLLAVATSIGIWLYNAHTGEEITLLPQPKQVNVLAFSHDGKTLASGESEYQGYESAVRLWDIETGNMVSDFTGKWKEIKALAYTSGWNKTRYCWRFIRMARRNLDVESHRRHTSGKRCRLGS